MKPSNQRQSTECNTKREPWLKSPKTENTNLMKQKKCSKLKTNGKFWERNWTFFKKWGLKKKVGT